MGKKSYEEAFKKWGSAWKEENLSEDVRKLIKQANFDLFYGPINDGAVGDPAEGDEDLAKYPGFTTACKQIRDAIDALPSSLYVDEETDEVRESEPEQETCGDCHGEGGNGEGICEGCNGVGGFEPAGTWVHLERREIRSLIVGSELVSYL